MTTTTACTTAQMTGDDGTGTDKDYRGGVMVVRTASLDLVRDISERVRRLLECPVCMSLAARMTCLCANGHMVCAGCRIRLYRQVPVPRCPMCRSPLVQNGYTFAASHRLSLVASALRVACPYRAYGCAQLFRLSRVMFHESECAYTPTTRCLVSACQWVGVHSRLFEHVRRTHRHVGVNTSLNRLWIQDANSITSYRRRSYLVDSPSGLFWVLLFKETRDRLRVGVFYVRDDSDVRSSVPSDRRNRMYRVLWSDAGGSRYRTRSKTAVVGCSTSLNAWTNGVFGGRAHSYAMIRRNTGRLEVYWFERRCIG